MQSLAAQLGGLNESEQQCDQHPVFASHPRQKYLPPSVWQLSPFDALQAMPHAPQLLSLVVSMATPLQHRAKSSPLFQL